MIKDKLKKALETALDKMKVQNQSVEIEKTVNPAFGDFSTNIAMRLTKTLKRNPLTIAEDIIKNLPKDEAVQKIEAVKPGFINFWISEKYFLPLLPDFSKANFSFPSYHLGNNKKLMIEFAHPNTHKLFHIGHLRNISIGESLVRIFVAVGNKVIRSNYQGDIGLHIAKTLWYLRYKTTNEELDEIRKKTLHERMLFLGKAYSKGQIAYEEDEKAKKQIIQINGMIYQKKGEILPLWKETVKWSFDYFDQIYKRVYSKFDRLYPESEFADEGITISKSAETKGFLKKSEGALVFKGKAYGLDTRVFINSLGYPTYEGKELALAQAEFSEFGELDKCIHVVTPEQKSFFKVTFKVEELLDEKKFKNKQFHLAYEWVRLKQGKMSSRTGNVIEAEWLIDEAKKNIREKFTCDDETAEKIAVAAVKYSILKTSVFSQIAFDFDESISLEGNSGPYLLYTYVRTQSVLKKAKNQIGDDRRQFGNKPLKEEERELLTTFHQFPDIVYEAAKQYSPNLIANYLFDLSQKFNLFYQKHKIIETEEPSRHFRLLLTKSTGEIIKKGLDLLGIKTVDKM